MKELSKNVLLNLLTLLGLALCLTSCEKEVVTPTGNEFARFETSNCVRIDLQVYLEGAYNPLAQEMTTRLNTRGLLPGQKPVGLAEAPTPAGQPYGGLPWKYAGTEGADWTGDNYTGSETDWVLVSFRTDIAKDTEIARAAALLNKNGSLAFFSDCVLEANEGDALYVVVEHRSHMGIMSAKPIQVKQGAFVHDFRTANSYDGGNGTGAGQKEVAPGVFAMYTGDVDQSDLISYDINGKDRNLWMLENGKFNVYSPADCNLDGEVNGADKSGWIRNNGRSSRVPK